MTNEKLKRANELTRQIAETKDYIRLAQWTQDKHKGLFTLRRINNDKNITIPDSLLKVIGTLIINEHQQNLNELETEFNNL